MKTFKLLFEKQGYNYFGLIALLAIAFYLTNWAGSYDGGLWGIGTIIWFWISLSIAIIHQFLVWFFWRTEMHLKLISRWFGKQAFLIWAIIFMIFFISRFLFVFILGFANRGTWNINTVLAGVLIFIILIPVLYSLYSIKKYFGLKRALGIDHFNPEYQKLGLVRKGIYKYTSNAMYVFVALLIWTPALMFASKAALISAFFNHAYLWVHYYTLESPDMKRIYFNK